MCDATPVVLDLGTSCIKVGFSTSRIPGFVLPNIVGRPIFQQDPRGLRPDLKDIMIADETTAFRQYLELPLLVERGVVTSWADETLVLDYIWKQKLHIEPKDHPVLIAEPPTHDPLANRKLMFEVFYETLGVEALQISPQAPLVLYAQGLVTGLSVDSGEESTFIVPIIEDYVRPDLMCRIGISGRAITENMAELLRRRGYAFHATSDFYTLREIKDKHTFVSADINKDRAIANETAAYVVPYKLPDGRVIRVADERFEGPEILFQPLQVDHGLSETRVGGISEAIYDTIMKADINMRKTFFESIVLSGGTTLLRGLSTRLYNDLQKLVLWNILKGKTEQLRDFKIQVEAVPRRRFLVYEGGTMLANLAKGKRLAWAWKSEYAESGGDVIAKRWQTVSR